MRAQHAEHVKAKNQLMNERKKFVSINFLFSFMSAVRYWYFMKSIIFTVEMSGLWWRIHHLLHPVQALKKQACWLHQLEGGISETTKSDCEYHSISSDFPWNCNRNSRLAYNTRSSLQKCNICGKAFNSHSTRFLHIKKEHGKYVRDRDKSSNEETKFVSTEVVRSSDFIMILLYKWNMFCFLCMYRNVLIAQKYSDHFAAFGSTPKMRTPHYFRHLLMNSKNL